MGGRNCGGRRARENRPLGLSTKNVARQGFSGKLAGAFTKVFTVLAQRDGNWFKRAGPDKRTGAQQRRSSHYACSVDHCVRRNHLPPQTVPNSLIKRLTGEYE